MFCLRTLRELKLLKFLSECGVSENVRSFYVCLLYSRLIGGTISVLDHFDLGHNSATFTRSIQRGVLCVPLAVFSKKCTLIPY